jgi:hypothetical protein
VDTETRASEGTEHGVEWRTEQGGSEVGHAWGRRWRDAAGGFGFQVVSVVVVLVVGVYGWAYEVLLD